MAILAGVWRPTGEDVNFPGSFQLQQYDGPGILSVAGDPAPDCSGSFRYSGTYNEHPYYIIDGGAYFLWYGNGYWNITTALGSFPDGDGWYVQQAEPPGTYAPSGTFTGNPEVSTIACSIIRVNVQRSSSGPDWSRAPYPVSIMQRDIRRKFAALARLYALIDPQDALRVTTSMESADIDGVPIPDVTARYTQVNAPPTFSPWENVGTGFDIWWAAALPAWVISDNRPVLPVPADAYWQRDSHIWYGTYAPMGVAEFNCDVSSVTFDGKFLYVGEHIGNKYWYNPNREAWIWRHPVSGFWYLATTYPNNPGGADTFWLKAGPDPDGSYTAAGQAEGTAIISFPE